MQDRRRPPGPARQHHAQPDQSQQPQHTQHAQRPDHRNDGEQIHPVVTQEVACRACRIPANAELDDEDDRDGVAKRADRIVQRMGLVKIDLDEIEIDIFYSKPNYEEVNMPGKVLGLDSLLSEKEREKYGIKTGEPYEPLSLEIETSDPDGWGTHLHQKITGSNVTELFKECVQKHWAKVIEQEAQDAG